MKTVTLLSQLKNRSKIADQKLLLNGNPQQSFTAL